MTTILGEDISIVRPVLPRKPIIPKEPFHVKHNKRARTRKIGKRELQKLKSKYEEELNAK